MTPAYFLQWAEANSETSRKRALAALLARHGLVERWRGRIPNAVEVAYRRTDFFDKRRILMAEWAQYVASGGTLEDVPTT